jgi:hypothetical protein
VTKQKKFYNIDTRAVGEGALVLDPCLELLEEEGLLAEVAGPAAFRALLVGSPGPELEANLFPDFGLVKLKKN